MKKKTFRLKKHFAGWRPGDYFRQLSVVVLGIIITFVGSNLITQSSSQRKLKSALQLLVTELEINRDNIQGMMARYEQERTFGLYLEKYQSRISEADEDLLKQNQYLFFQQYNYGMSAEAFEMIKMAGLLQEIADQSLIIEIISAYKDVERSVGNFRMYTNSKARLQQSLDDDPHWLKWWYDSDLGHLSGKEVFAKMLTFPNFVRLYALPIGFLESETSFNSSMGVIEKTVARIRAAYDLPDSGIR